MARSQKVKIREAISIRQVPDATEDYQGDYVALVEQLDIEWGSGTTVGKSDKFYSVYGQSIAAGATLSLDLDSRAGGPDGAAVSFAEIRAIIIKNRSGLDATVVNLEPNVTNGWTALGASLVMDIQNGASYRYVCPTDGVLPVSASDKVLDLVNQDGSNAATVDIVIVGTSA